MTDTAPPPTYEQLVELTIAEIIKRGTIERVNTIMEMKSELTADEIETLVDHAQMRMVSSAPEPIRSSITLVISFHRWNDIYNKSTSAADRIAAQKQLDRLMQSVH